MADLAKLVVRLEAQSAQLLTELEKANRKIDRFAAQTTKTLQKWSGGLLAAFSARALIQFGASVLNAQDNLNDLAQKAGVSVETLSRLGYAAEQSGTDIAGLETGLAKLSKTAVAAAEGSKASAEAFEALGVEAQNADGSIKATDQLLLEIADSFAAHADGAAKSALAQAIFGKSGADLIPFLNQGAAGIEELTKKADELGITIGGKAAKAADDFNDNMATLAAVTRGVVGKALGELTPIMNSFSEDLLTGAQNSGTFDKAARVLATGLKLLLSAGVIVGEVFDRLGSAVGAAAAAIVAVLQRDFGRAVDIVIQANKDHLTSAAETAEQLGKIWADAGVQIVEEAAKTDEKLKKSFSFGGNADGLQEITIGLQKIDVSAMEQVYADLDALTQTSNEKALSAYYQQKAALDELSASQRISALQYSQRLEEVNQSLADATGITERQNEALARQKQIMDEGRGVWEATRTPLEQYEQALVRLNLLLQQGAIDQETYGRAVEQAQDQLDEASGKMTDFAEQARRNVQDILGQGLVDAVKGSSQDILQTFSDMIVQLVAQAVAADLAGKLLGTGKNGDNGLVGTALSAIGSYLTRDSGGRGSAGGAYAIGVGAQPELFVPDTAGTFIPRDDWMGGGARVSNNFYIQTPDGRVPLQTQQQIATRASQSLMQAQRRNA